MGGHQFGGGGGGSGIKWECGSGQLGGRLFFSFFLTGWS